MVEATMYQWPWRQVFFWWSVLFLTCLFSFLIFISEFVFPLRILVALLFITAFLSVALEFRYLLKQRQKDISELAFLEGSLHSLKKNSALRIFGPGAVAWEYDIENDRLTWDDNAQYNFFGRVTDFVLPSNLKELMMCTHYDDRARFQSEFQNALKTNKVQFSPMRIIHPDKAMHIYEFVGSISKNHGVKLEGICRDVTEDKIYESRLNEPEYRAFVETTSDWIWTVDKDSKLTFSNPSIEPLLGYTPEEVLGMEMFHLVPDDQMKQAKEFFSEHVAKMEGWKGHIEQWRHKNGSLKWFESSAHPIISRKGELLGFRGADRDETERVSLDKMKDDFVSMVSHELRTPLTSIRGALGIVVGGHEASPEKQSKLLQIAQKGCERLVIIINDILDVQRIVGGDFKIHPVKIDVAHFIDEVVAANKHFAEKFDVKLVVKDVPSGVSIISDPNRLMQVMTNLVSNAIKFSPEHAEVMLSATSTANTVRFSVTDHGPGISEKILPHIFEKFVREELPGSIVTPGTGLGLNISKIIVERLGGTIDFVTKKGEGTTFFIDLKKDAKF
jgi:PAS domain S-box-containing protein